MESLNCPSCGSPNLTKVDAIEYKCVNCGTHSKLSQDQTILIIQQQGSPCPSCGFNNENQSAFCGKCGSKLIKYCTSCKSEVQLSVNFCSKCGKTNFSPNKPGIQIILVNVGRRKIDVIRIVNELRPKLGLVNVRNLVETPNAVIIEDVSDTIAKSIKSSLEKAGALVEIR